MSRQPTHLGAEFRRVDRIAKVMAGPVLDRLVVVRGAPELGEDVPDDLEVVALAVGADEIGVADRSALEDGQHGAAVVLDVNPVAHVGPESIHAGAHVVDEVGNLSGDELLDVLVGPVVVGAVTDRCRDAERTHPGSDPVSYTHLRAHETDSYLVCRLLLEKKK